MIRCEDMHDFDEAVKLRGASEKWPRAIGWAFAGFVLLLSDNLFVEGYYFGKATIPFMFRSYGRNSIHLSTPTQAITRITNQFSWF